MRAIQGASSSSTDRAFVPLPKGSKAKGIVGKAHVDYRSAVSPRDSVVPSSALAIDPEPKVSLRFPGSSTSSSYLHNANEEQSSLSPETYSWWSETLTQIIYVGYLFVNDMSTVNMGSDKCHCENIIRFASQ